MEYQGVWLLRCWGDHGGGGGGETDQNICVKWKNISN